MQKNVTLHDILAVAERLWPTTIAEQWDRVGLTVGDRSQQVQKVLFAVDVTRATVAEAIAWGADLLITHHPLLLRGVHTIAADTYKGALLTDLVRANVSLLSCHTNADAPDQGVSDVLATALGLTETEPIVATFQGGLDEHGATKSGWGIGRVGTLTASVSLQEFAEKLISVLPVTAVGARIAGASNRRVQRVALLGGSGDSLLMHPLVVSADVYVTSDLRHHPAQEALEQYAITGGPALIDVPHWASESLWLETAAKQLAAELLGLETKISKINTDPWSMRVG